MYVRIALTLPSLWDEHHYVPSHSCYPLLFAIFISHSCNFNYRKAAQKWHPDNFQGDEKKIAEKKFIDIAAAKEVLTDPGRPYFRLTTQMHIQCSSILAHCVCLIN
jgi:hypothetical protein